MVCFSYLIKTKLIFVLIFQNVLNINISLGIFKRHNQSIYIATVKYIGKKYEIYKIRNKHHDSKVFQH